MSNAPITIIAGPTASGKSAYALDLAQKSGGQIFNADSVQVYRDLSILTARPSATDTQLIPHHGYGFIDADSTFSVGLWHRWIDPYLQRHHDADFSMFIVGGTGLYLRSLICPLAIIPDIDPAIRQNLQHYMSSEGLQGLDKLYQQLQQCDPLSYARIAPQDNQRILRALEVYQGTGKSLSFWQNQPTKPVNYLPKKILMLPDRQQLYKRASDRVVHMFYNGAVEEITCLMKQQVPSSAPIFKALGSQHIYNYLLGNLTFDHAITLTQQQTRQYIKTAIHMVQTPVPSR